MTQKQFAENEFATFYIENGVMYFTYKQTEMIDLAAAKKIVLDRVNLQNGVSYPVICDARGLKNMNKEARDYLAKEGSALVSSVALIVTSTATRIMSNFYLSVNKPEVPTKLFNSLEEASEFIHSTR